jgi:hypothetical protein
MMDVKSAVFTDDQSLFLPQTPNMNFVTIKPLKPNGNYMYHHLLQQSLGPTHHFVFMCYV